MFAESVQGDRSTIWSDQEIPRVSKPSDEVNHQTKDKIPWVTNPPKPLTSTQHRNKPKRTAIRKRESKPLLPSKWRVKGISPYLVHRRAGAVRPLAFHGS